MRLDRLTVKGLFAFREPVTLDATALPRGVIAIVGANGEGKTGLIECAIAAIHQEFPTREKPLPDYTNQREAFIEGDYTLADGRYRARINIDGQTRKCGATLSRWLGAPEDPRVGQWVPLNERGQVSTFGPEVAKRFPSLSVLLATAFAAQNRRGAFSDLDERERKELFQELLGLGRFQAWSAAALEIVRAIEKRKDAFDVLRFRLAAETGEPIRAALEATAQRLQADLLEAGGRVDTLARALEAARHELDAAITERHAVEGRIAERRRLAQALAEARAAFDTVLRQEANERATWEGDEASLNAAHKAALGRLEAQAQAIPTDAAIDAAHEARVALERRQHDADVADRTARLANNRSLLERADEIARAAADLVELEAAREAPRTTRQIAIARVTEAERAVQEARAAVGHDPRASLATARASAALIDSVPFGAKCAEAACQFVRLAVTARDSVPALEADVQRYDAACAVGGVQLAALALARADLADVDRQIAEIETAITAHEREKTRDRAARLATAQERTQDLEADIEQIGVRLSKAIAISSLTATSERTLAAERRAALEQDRATADATATDGRARAHAAHVGRLKALDGQRCDAFDRIDLLTVTAGALESLAEADAGAAQRALDVQARVDELTTGHAHALTQAARLTAEADASRASLAALQRKTDELGQVAAALAQLDAELTEWAFLAAATSRDGLPTLEIDAAGPMVSARANDLLATCYGAPRFTIEIVTQDTRAKGGLKEVFEMKVWDAHDMRRPRDLADLSGGEKILVDEAVKCALALHVNDHHQVALRTCFRDETTSALHHETAMRYLTMLRRVQERGGIEQLFFITHNAAVAAQADAQIEVAGGRLHVRLPPYEDVAAWSAPQDALAS